jgi:competence protein ComEA
MRSRPEGTPERASFETSSGFPRPCRAGESVALLPVVAPPANFRSPFGAKTYSIPTSRVWRYALLCFALALFAGSAGVKSSAGQGQPLPDGPGKEETQKLCSGCHELDRSVSPRQDRAGWQQTMNKMVAFGMKGTEQELSAVLEYLVKHYPAEEVPRINVNKAKAIELESGLSLKRSQAAAIIEYREKHGDFKSIEDLKKVPGVDAAKIEAKKDRLIF